MYSHHTLNRELALRKTRKRPDNKTAGTPYRTVDEAAAYSERLREEKPTLPILLLLGSGAIIPRGSRVARTTSRQAKRNCDREA